MSKVFPAKHEGICMRLANEHEIPKPQSEAIRVGRLLIVPDDFAAFLDGEEIDLSFKEFKLLLLLARNHGHVVTRDETPGDSATHLAKRSMA